MDCKIYLITDCNNRKYVGKTKLTLKERLYKHKSQKCSSRLLNLNDCKIELLEECNKENNDTKTTLTVLDFKTNAPLSQSFFNFDAARYNDYYINNLD